MQIGTRVRNALLKLVGILRGGPSPTADAQQDTSNALLDLPPEVLLHVLTYITDESKDYRLPAVSQLAEPARPHSGMSAPLFALSNVNRRTRFLCRPKLFHIIKIDPTDTLPPTTILQFVQFMHISTPSSDAPWGITRAFLLQMTQLTHVYWDGEGTLKQAELGHLCLLLASPTMHTLTLSNIWLHGDASDLGISSSCLRSLRIDFSHQVENRRSVDTDVIESHLTCLHPVLDLLRPGLENLMLSGYSARLSSLAAAPWPSLRTFFLTRGDAALDAPWDRLLLAMPALCSLAVALDSGEQPLVLFDDEAAARASALSRISHFTISLPHPGDRVFAALPPDLLELSLRDTPRYYSLRTAHIHELHNEPLLACSDVLKIFSAFTAIHLSALELVYLEDPDEFRMLAALTQSCPSLSLLELHRYPRTMSRRDAWYFGELTIPVVSIAEVLAEFKALRVLKLNLCFTDYEVMREPGTLPSRYWESLAEFLDAHAQSIAQRVPWIETLCILAWSPVLMRWYTWSVHAGDSAGMPRVVHEEIPLTGCTDCEYY